jgi:hypothetical protein
MGRSGQYLTTADYSIGYGDNPECLTKGFGHPNEADAMRAANEYVGQMRREGAASPIRRVRVRYWEKGGELVGAPLLFSASYYDFEQLLTEAETYAARVHDWHEPGDRMNRNQIASDSRWRTGHRPWSDDWGPRPATTCPACDAPIRD